MRRVEVIDQEELRDVLQSVDPTTWSELRRWKRRFSCRVLDVSSYLKPKDEAVQALLGSMDKTDTGQAAW